MQAGVQNVKMTKLTPSASIGVTALDGEAVVGDVVSEADAEAQDFYKLGWPQFGVPKSARPRSNADTRSDRGQHGRC